MRRARLLRSTPATLCDAGVHIAALHWGRRELKMINDRLQTRKGRRVVPAPTAAIPGN